MCKPTPALAMLTGLCHSPSHTSSIFTWENSCFVQPQTWVGNRILGWWVGCVLYDMPLSHRGVLGSIYSLVKNSGKENCPLFFEAHRTRRQLISPPILWKKAWDTGLELCGEQHTSSYGKLPHHLSLLLLAFRQNSTTSCLDRMTTWNIFMFTWYACS